MGQLSQDFQEILIFEYGENGNVREMFSGFNFSFAFTHKIGCISKTMGKFMFIKMTKLQSKTRTEFYTEWIINTKQRVFFFCR